MAATLERWLADALADGIPRVALRRGDEAQRAVTVLMVVPVHEARRPLARHVEVGEAANGEAGTVFGGAELRFDEGVVVADAGARVRHSSSHAPH